MTKRPSIATLAPRKAAAPAPLPASAAPVASMPNNKVGSAYKSILSKVDAATHRQMKILAANEDAAVGDLQIEALNLLFRSRGLPEIATRVTPDERDRVR